MSHMSQMTKMSQMSRMGVPGCARGWMGVWVGACGCARVNVLDDPFFQEPDRITFFCHITEPDPITIFLPAKWARSDRDLDQIIPDHF